MLSFQSFLEKGYTKRQRKLARESVVNRVHFFFGLRIAYIAFLLGFSANLFTIVRLPLAIIGFHFLTLSGFDNFTFRILGLSLIALQKFFDFGDGAIARVTEQSSAVGRQLDIFVDFVTKMMTFGLIAYFTEAPLIIISSTALVYMHWRTVDWVDHGRSFLNDKSRNVSFIRYSDSDKDIAMPSILKHIVSAAALLYLLPLFVVLFNSPDDFYWFKEACISLFLIYTIIISLMFYISLFPKNNG